jgi:hypothetical protein
MDGRSQDRQPQLGEATQPPMTLEAFQARWGNCDFEDGQLANLWSTSAGYYIDLPYHNFEHSLATLWAAMELADTLEVAGLAVNRRVLIGAALFHDAGFHEPVIGSKEAYAASKFTQHAAGFGFSEQEIELGQLVILDTIADRQPETVEGKILVRADLANIANDYETGLLHNTNLLYEEATRLTGNKIDFNDFTKISVDILTTYLSHDLYLGALDSTFAEWRARALNNLQRLAVSVEGRQVPPKLAILLGAAAIESSSA